MIATPSRETGRTSGPLELTDYLSAGRTLRAAVLHLTPADLTAFPVPGAWSIQQIIGHLYDADAIWTHRMKLAIAHDNPTFTGYDETLFSQRLAYHDLPVDETINLFELNRKHFAHVLRAIPAEAWTRTGHHQEFGTLSLRQMVDRMVDHVGHHLPFIHHKRALLGKPEGAAR